MFLDKQNYRIIFNLPQLTNINVTLVPDYKVPHPSIQ